MNMAWQGRASRITTGVLSYTHHTLLPEALEKWPVPPVEDCCPVTCKFIYLINALHLDGVRAEGNGHEATLAAISLIEGRGPRRVPMGALCSCRVARS